MGSTEGYDFHDGVRQGESGAGDDEDGNLMEERGSGGVISETSNLQETVTAAQDSGGVVFSQQGSQVGFSPDGGVVIPGTMVSSASSSASSLQSAMPTAQVSPSGSASGGAAAPIFCQPANVAAASSAALASSSMPPPPAPGVRVPPPFLPCGYRRVACKARTVPSDHRPENAFFVIPNDAEHGYDLTCSHPLCEKNKFRYCKVCDVPVARRNFPRRHGHNLLPRVRGAASGATQHRSWSSVGGGASLGGSVGSVYETEDCYDEKGTDEIDNELEVSEFPAPVRGPRRASSGGGRQRMPASSRPGRQGDGAAKPSSFDRMKRRLDAPLTTVARVRRKSAASEGGSQDGSSAGGTYFPSYSGSSVLTEPNTQDARKRAMKRRTNRNQQDADEEEEEEEELGGEEELEDVEENTRYEQVMQRGGNLQSLMPPSSSSASASSFLATAGRRMGRKLGQIRGDVRSASASTVGGPDLGSSATSLFARMKTQLDSPAAGMARLLAPSSASEGLGLKSGRGRLPPMPRRNSWAQEEEGDDEQEEEDDEELLDPLEVHAASIQNNNHGDALKAASDLIGVNRTDEENLKAAIEDWEMDTSDFDLDDAMDDLFNEEEGRHASLSSMSADGRQRRPCKAKGNRLGTNESTKAQTLVQQATMTTAAVAATSAQPRMTEGSFHENCNNSIVLGAEDNRVSLDNKAKQASVQTVVDDVVGSIFQSSAYRRKRQQQLDKLLNPRQRRWLQLLEERPEAFDESAMKSWLKKVVADSEPGDEKEDGGAGGYDHVRDNDNVADRKGTTRDVVQDQRKGGQGTLIEKSTSSSDRHVNGVTFSTPATTATIERAHPQQQQQPQMAISPRFTDTANINLMGVTPAAPSPPGTTAPTPDVTTNHLGVQVEPVSSSTQTMIQMFRQERGGEAVALAMGGGRPPSSAFVQQAEELCVPMEAPSSVSPLSGTHSTAKVPV